MCVIKKKKKDSFQQILFWQKNKTFFSLFTFIGLPHRHIRKMYRCYLLFYFLSLSISSSTLYRTRAFFSIYLARIQTWIFLFFLQAWRSTTAARFAENFLFSGWKIPFVCKLRGQMKFLVALAFWPRALLKLYRDNFLNGIFCCCCSPPLTLAHQSPFWIKHK